MRILHVLQSPHFSGAENVVCQIIGMFKNESGYDMAYCSQDGVIRDALQERNILFYPMTVLCVSEVRRVIKEYHPDVIHAHDMRASFISAISCGNIPLISHIHNNSFQSRGLSTKSIAYILAGIKAKHIFWVSNSSYNGYVFRKFFEKKSSVLQNIVDIDALYKKMQSDDKTYNYDIVYVGRLTYPKNPERLLDVLDCVCKMQKNLKIAIVGTGDLEETVKNISKQKHLDRCIDFLGFCSNPLKIIHDSKVMIMTSRWEGTPMCALEAQSLGVPIVSTPTDGLCDIITNGVNGYLSEDNNVLAEELCEIINNDALREKMSAASIELMRQMQNKKTYIDTIKKAYKGDQL